MPIPRLVRTSREDKRTAIKNLGAQKLVWIIGVKVKMFKGGIQQMVWRVGNYPTDWMPWIPVRGDDEKRDPVLKLMMDFFLDAGGDYEVEPFLLDKAWLKEIEEDIKTYEWPYYPNDSICPNCFSVEQWRPSELAPVRCELCDTLFLREIKNERGTVEEV